MFRKILLFIILLFSVSAIAQIERVEPAFWWTGMKNTQLQLLIHGPEICNRQVEIKYPGVEILKTNRACSPNYLFVTLKIDSKITKPGNFTLKLIQANFPDLTYNYELKQRRRDSESRKGFSSSDVIYLLMPDRFSNGDTTNDNVASQPEKVNRNIDYGRHGGDIKGISNNLKYIKELGATAIWCTPLQENNYTKFTYHGYAISDYYKIDPRYGSNEEYTQMVAGAHSEGLKVIMDMVSNHCGIWNWWMSDLPFEDWIHQWPTYTQSNHKAKTLKDIHGSKADKIQMTDGWFDTTMPDMNQQNQYFWNYFIQNSIWWVEYANLDGIRMDTYPYNDRDAMATWSKAIMTEYPDFNIMGETWLFNPQDIAFWQKNSVNTLNYNSELPTVMDFILQKSLSTCFNEHGKSWEDVGMNRLYNTIADDYLYPDINNLLIFAENHDTQRYNLLLANSFAKYKMAMSFLMTTRGIPQIYYGTEIGMTGDKNKGDGDVRKDFPGGWAEDAKSAFVKEERTSVQQAYFDFTSKLLQWRKSQKLIHTGKLLHFVPLNDVYVYFRYNDLESVMVILNNNETSQTLNLDRYKEGLRNNRKGTDVISGIQFDLNDSITIPAQTAFIIQLE